MSQAEGNSGEPIKKANSNQNWKVKVYLLNESGNWDDCGKGYSILA